MNTYSSSTDSERAARASKRHSVSKLYSMVHAEHDTEVEDDLSRSTFPSVLSNPQPKNNYEN
jgi:hypothetical protein